MVLHLSSGLLWLAVFSTEALFPLLEGSVHWPEIVLPDSIEDCLNTVNPGITATWQDAKDHCEGLGGALPMPKTTDDNSDMLAEMTTAL